MKLSDFNIKNGNKKSVDNFINRLEIVENKKGIRNKEREETDSEKIHKCAELRLSRVRKLAEVMGYNEAVAWQRVGISDYELAFELECFLRSSPERRYQTKKNRWLWHESSWFMRRFTTMPLLTQYDGQGCNDSGCIVSCRFYEPTGRIEDSELIKLEEQEHKKEKELIVAEYRLLGFNDNDSDEKKKQKWAEIHEVKNQISKQISEYLEQRQHGWQSSEDLKAIEDAAWAEFYKSKNKNTEQQQ